MNLKTALLISGLCCLSSVSWAEGVLKIRYTVDITDFPRGNTLVSVICAVGVGPAPTAAFSTWEPAALVAQGAQVFEVPSESRVLRRTAVMPLAAIPPGTLAEATHFKCRLSNAPGQPVFRGPEISGPIIRPAF